jgi:hypothetical protein
MRAETGWKQRPSLESDCPQRRIRFKMLICVAILTLFKKLLILATLAAEIQLPPSFWEVIRKPPTGWVDGPGWRPSPLLRGFFLLVIRSAS